MTDVTVNGKTIRIPGCHSICIVNNQILVDGQPYKEDEDLKQAKIIIEGNCESLQVGSCSSVEVKGNCGSVNAGGPVSVGGKVDKDVKAGGSVKCGDVGGNVEADGSVNCGNISGDLKAGGSVMYKK